MYQEILSRYQETLSFFPLRRRPLIGSVIKEIRVDKGIRQQDFAASTGLNLSTLKSIENDHQTATTVENLENCCRELGVSVDDLILRGRERDPCNFFALRKKAPPEVKGIRQRKRTPPDWHEALRIKFRDFDITPISPPLSTRRDFMALRVHIPPKRSISGLRLEEHSPVLGFLSTGFHMRITYGQESMSLTSNQGFILDGYHRHDILNEDEDHAAVLYLITQLHRPQPSKTVRRKAEAASSIRIGAGIETIRERCSDRPGQKIPLTHLADLTDGLDHEQLAKMARLKKGSSVVYWEKIEDLLGGVNVNMEDFLSWSRGMERMPVKKTTAVMRAMLDYSTYHGLKIYTCNPTEIGHRFFCGELLMEPKKSIEQKPWQRKDNAMVALYAEQGEIEISAGRYRTPLTLLKGESLYFDGSLGYLIRNPGAVQAKGFMATFPAIVP